jgi:hypothetical protein
VSEGAHPAMVKYREHEHRPIGRDDFVREDGIREVWWKCGCGLEEKRFFEADRCVGVKYRIGSRWMDAQEWLMFTIPMRLCDVCEGAGCAEGCNWVGVVETSGAWIEPPPAPAPPRRAI